MRLRSKQATARCSIKKEDKTNKQTTTNVITETSRRQTPSCLSPFIRLLILPSKRQDRASNGNSERIQSVLCEDMLHVKRIIKV